MIEYTATWARSIVLSLIAPMVAMAASPNVLLILVDDLKPAMGCYGDSNAITPNLDKLAERGMRFDLAYCNQAVCAPSRFNLMLGSLSTSTGLYGLGQSLRQRIPDAVTLQQHFMKHGHRSIGIGKVFHIGHGNPGDMASFDTFHKDNVVEYVLSESRETQVTTEEAMFTLNLGGGSLHEYRKKHKVGRGAAIEAANVPDDAYADGRTAQRAIEYLQKFKASGEPFIISAGFARPHLPFTAPKKYFDQHDISKFRLPAYREAPKGAPPYALRGLMGEIGNYFPVTERIHEDAYQLEFIRAYYASTTYVDAQIGKVLDELERLEMADDTIVVLWGDHGWHLGDHGRFSKHDNYEQPTRIPLVFAGPGVKAGASTKQLASTIDIYPTLAELAGLPRPTGPQPIDGLSLVPVLDEPAKRIRDHITHCYPKQRLGRAIRNERYRMVQWGRDADMREPEFELYDYQRDLDETVNIAGQHPEIVEAMRKTLRGYGEGVRR